MFHSAGVLWAEGALIRFTGNKIFINWIISFYLSNMHAMNENMAITQHRLIKEQDLASNGTLVILNKDKFIEALRELDSVSELDVLKTKIIPVLDILINPKSDRDG